MPCPGGRRRSRVMGRTRSQAGSLVGLRSGKFGDDAECKIDSRSDAACGEDITVSHDSPLFVIGADQSQQIDVGPVRRSPTALEQAGRSNAPVHLACPPWRRTNQFADIPQLRIACDDRRRALIVTVIEDATDADVIVWLQFERPDEPFRCRAAALSSPALGTHSTCLGQWHPAAERGGAVRH